MAIGHWIGTSMGHGLVAGSTGEAGDFRASRLLEQERTELILLNGEDAEG